ncbi:MAG: alpha/beta hydrolase [bacterium]|nr:alpha/beta hydrolase [bacterium]
MTEVELGDIVVNYRRHGSGPAVVLLHGLAEDHRSWSPVAPYLGSFTTYAVDLRGHGRTTAGRGAGTLMQLSDDLIIFLQAVSGPAAVVGYSLGGAIGLKAATAAPDLIRHLVVVATSSVVGRAAAGFFAGRIAQLESGDSTGFAAGLRDDTALQIVTEADLDSLAADRVAAVGDGHGYINAARAMIGIRAEPLNPLLSRITAPLDIVGADRDVFCPRRASDIIADAVPHSRFHEIAGAGHLLSVDRPEAYGRLLARLLRGSATR